jgi:hypothetical protein
MSAALAANETPQLADAEEPYWSKLAIATFVLSLTSPLAIFSNFFWPTAFLTVAFGVAAVILAARGRGVVRGGILACVAIFLALFCLSFAIARYAAKANAMRNDARAAAEKWFDLIKEGKLNEAHQMTMGSEFRESPEIPLDEAYKLNPKLANSRDGFFLQPPIKHLVNDPKNCTVQFVGFNDRGDVDERADSLKLRFKIRYKELGTPRETIFTMSVARYFQPLYEDHRWMMRGLAGVETK